MSEQAVRQDKPKIDRVKADRPKKRQRGVEFADFRTWLTSLDMHNPILHVNGTAYPMAVLAVDFGTPLVEKKLTTEQNGDLLSRLRTATKALFADRDVNVRVQNDGAYGVWWTSVG